MKMWRFAHFENQLVNPWSIKTNSGLGDYYTYKALFALQDLIFMLWFSHGMAKITISMLPTSLNMNYLNILIYTNVTAFMFTYIPKENLKDD